MLTDIVSLVRYSLEQDNELVPFREQVENRFAGWLLAQEHTGATFTPEQLQWLTWMKDSIASDLALSVSRLSTPPLLSTEGLARPCRSLATS